MTTPTSEPPAVAFQGAGPDAPDRAHEDESASSAPAHQHHASAAPSRQPTPRPRRTFPRISRQRNLATTAQLLKEGWTRAAIHHATGRTIQDVLPGVYAGYTGTIDEETRRMAAYLWAGKGSVLTGIAALRLHGLTVRGSDTLIFLVPNSRRARTARGVRTVRTRRRPPLSALDSSLSLASVARALVGAALHQKLSHHNLRGAALSALQRRLTTVEAVETELGRAPAGPSLAGMSQALEDFNHGAWSIPEGDLKKIAESRPELAAMLLNPILSTDEGDFVGVPDGYFEAEGVAVQVHSRQHHSGENEHGEDLWVLTVEKDTDYLRHGVIVVGVTPSSISRRPAAVGSRLVAILSRYSGRDLSHILVKSRDQLDGRTVPSQR